MKISAVRGFGKSLFRMVCI